ncbi:DUF4249 domain-containing protein [Alkalitalea saponilacus]|uniref:DUF4249 domain-containing protein n=1 Tax=Alkalitalea saponilacus TaxID=889453 RepID=A0A1T5HT42_9BACT|nr:DUF4249 domain-containing protein [Alkalitalea saponilacus]ASB48530.1 hypothetical protein CDL62_04945 [Alkalitalea saponilacus]SKC23846.1 protein of unknown function [Alkalitalea saponilacus]
MRVLIFSLVFIVFGCEQEVEVDLTKGFEPEIVVSSFFSPQDSIRVLVTLTQPAYSNRYRRVRVSSAWLEDGFNQRHQLIVDEHFFDTDLLSSGIPDFTPGSAVTLVVESDELDKLVTAVDTIPQPAYLRGFEIIPVKDEHFYYVGGTIIPPIMDDENDLYYEIILYSTEREPDDSNHHFYKYDYPFSHHYLITREDYYPGVMLIGAVGPPTLLWRSNKREPFYIDFYYDSPSIHWNPIDGYRFPKHHLKIELRTVSKTYFDYKTSLYRQQYAVEGDFLYGLAPPVSVRSNVVGGTGIFAGFCKVDTVIPLEARSFK